jgi:hypothetical protein
VTRSRSNAELPQCKSQISAKNTRERRLPKVQVGSVCTPSTQAPRTTIQGSGRGMDAEKRLVDLKGSLDKATPY